MKTSIAIFNSHHEALTSLVNLKEHHFPMKNVSLIGKAEIIEDKIHIRSNNTLLAAPVAAGSIVGTTLGLLSGISLFAVPGFGFLFGAGAIIGALAGFQMGVVAGGIGTLLLQLGLSDDYVVKYNELINDGKFLLFIDGSADDIEKARKIIGERHSGYDIHKPIGKPGKVVKYS